MVKIPVAFAEYTRRLMGDERFERYLQSFDEETPVSIRLNPLKAAGMTVLGGEPVGWCRDGWYLPSRPVFTMDPLLHAGCYYVQEAASMFVCHVLQQYVDRPVSMLDLCAAPGGKSTAAIASLPAGSTLCANEPVRQRASILSENVAKWGWPGCTVTNQYPRDFRKQKSRYDVILCDVPCSGEGMFRKDAATIGEWSPQHVERCWQLQRSIVADIWPCLNDGGLLIYSTCTFNTKENEENVRWLTDEYDAQVLPVDVKPEWHIVGSLLEDFSLPVYRFIPGITRSEGLFMCVLRKGGDEQPATRKSSGKRPNDVVQCQSSSATVELSYQQAIAYLRGEALVLPADTPRGIVEVSFLGHVLGQMKNIGSRANNLYPKEWRIRTTHVPDEYNPILTVHSS